MYLADEVVRREESRDYEAFFAVVKLAFSAAEHPDGDERYLVEGLRKSAAFIPELSLMTECRALAGV